MPPHLPRNTFTTRAGPNVVMPIPEYGTNPALPSVADPLYHWGKGLSLLDNPSFLRHMTDRTYPDLYGALCFPACDLDRLLPLCQFVLWAFAVDDALDGDPDDAPDLNAVASIVEDLIRAINGRGSDSPSARAAQDISATLCHQRTREWCGALLDEIESWLFTYMTDTAATRMGRVMTIEEYLPHRRYSVAEVVFFLLVEYAIGIDLPEQARRLPSLVRARHRGSEWIGVYNDIASARKEAAVGYQHNAVLITVHHDGCAFQDATNTANTILTDLFRQFQEAVARVLTELDALRPEPALRRDLAQVLRGYQQLVRGNYDYHIGLARYADARPPHVFRPDFSADRIFRTHK